jgi:lipopolysaccharide/colanic/teichoic acid biosynthesis glycosyltransferase
MPAAPAEKRVVMQTLEISYADLEFTTPRFQVPRAVPRSWEITKRIMDVAIAASALLLFAPILAISMIAIIMSSSGEPLFVQERVGRYGRRFMMYKLRTMIPDADLHKDALRGNNEVSGPAFKMKHDPRVFPVGRFLRRTSIDELPNLLNVLLGDMSIVGPRPPLPIEFESYGEYAFQRLLVKPGITCLWQISGRSNVDFDRWMELDHRYMDNWSPLYDLKIILLTIPAVLFTKGAY